MNKKTVVITGSSRGIGAATARVFARENYNVVINYNNSVDKATSLFEELTNENLSVRMFKADISNRFEASSLINFCIGEFENIDILINNAGISQSKLFTDLNDDDWNNMMNVNLNGVFYTTQKALQYMIPNYSGKIINISSIWGLVGGASEVHYSTSKAALIGMTKALAKELGPSNITVNAIAPGVIQTDMLDDIDEDVIEDLRMQTPMMKIGTPEDIAKVCLFLAKDEFMTGQVISPNGGFVVY